MRVLCVFILTLVLIVYTETLPGPKHGKNVVCYFASWAVYRPGPGRFIITDLDPSLCTHLVYAFAGIDAKTNTIKSLNPWEDIEMNTGRSGYKGLVALKQKYPHLKVTLAVGGWDEGSIKFSNMASTPENRATFIESVLVMMNEHKFDGLDLHWKYPTARDGAPYDKENFVLLVKELSEAFKPKGYILTAAIGANKSTMEASYELDRLDPHLDLIHVLTYDYHGLWEKVIGANSPLNRMDEYDVFSIAFTLDYLLKHKVSPHKIVVGVPMFGRAFTLSNPNVKQLELGSTAAEGTAIKGPYTREPGFLGYNEICMETSNSSSNWQYTWHAQSSTPYLRDGANFITYDNGRSVAAKIKTAIDKGLGGVVVWTVDMDDVNQDCNETDAYVDFVERYQKIANNPLAKQAADNLKLPHDSTDGSFYVLKDRQLYLQVPQPSYSKFTLMNTINDAMALAIQEKRIEDEMKKIAKEKGVALDNTGPSHGKHVVCYLATWAVYRLGPGKFSLEDLELSLCTHLVYAFAGLNEQNNTIRSLDPWQDYEQNFGKDGYKRVVALKEKHPHLKVSLAVGGWAEGSVKFSNMAANAQSRATFIMSILDFLRIYKFDGITLGWKHPTIRGGKPYDKQNFVLLVKELSEAFKPYGYLLSAGLAAEKPTMESAYNLAELNKYLDLIHLMSYDYHGSWDGVVGANAPLKATDKNSAHNVEFSINYMISHGVSPNKLVLGLPLYGRTFVLNDPSVEELEYGITQVNKVGFQAPYTKEDGYIGFNEICMETRNKSSPWVYQWHEQTSTPYLRFGEKVITYDNGRSLASKVKMAVDKGLGGVMVWSIDTDDFRANCTENDAYVDFVERYQRMANDPLLWKAMRNLNLFHFNQAPKGPCYMLRNNKLHLRLPQTSHSNFTLMNTINDAMTLSIKEKVIEDEIAKLTRQNEISIMIEGDGDSTSVVRVFIVANAHGRRNQFQVQHNISIRFY